jgi:Peptidase family M23
MRICFMAAAVFALASSAPAEEYGRPTAIIVSPIHEAQTVRGALDSVTGSGNTLTTRSSYSTWSLDPAGKELMRIEGDALAAATQTLFARTETAVIPASAAVSVDVDLILPPDSAPEQVKHRIAYTLAADSQLALMIGSLQVDGPEVAINRRPPTVIKPPLTGNGWLASSGCCKPNVHRDLRIAIDGRRIETGETFAIDWARVKNDKIYDGNGKKVEQHYAFGEDVLAVADGTVVSTHDGMPDETPLQAMIPKAKEDYGGNHVMLEIAPNVFALYAHLHPGSLTVQVGDAVKARAVLGKIGNTGPSNGPHLHFALSDKPDFFAGTSLPFVFDSYTTVGAIDFDASEPDRLERVVS